MFDVLALVTTSTRCLAAGVLVRSLEALANRQEFPCDRLLGWRRAGIDRTGRLARVERAISAPDVAVFLLAARCAAAAACLGLPFTSATIPWLLGYLAWSQAYWNRRFRLIANAADVMFLIGLSAMFTASLDAADAQLQGIALTFLGLHALLAYLMAGLDKIRSPHWRGGRILTLTFESSNWRSDGVGTLLAGHPSLARVASWGVITVELLLPACVFLPTPAFHVVLALGASFHVAVAVLMGLHGFLWSFLSAYPGIYFIHHWLNRAWAPN